MAYSPTAWINNSEPAITAEKLNKMEFGIASAHGIAEAKASTDYVQGQIANEVNARITYVENSFANFEANLTGDNSIIIPVIEQELADPTSNSTTAIKQTAITATDTNWSLSTLTTNLASEFGENASNISTKLGTYASNDDVGAIAQVALDVDGRITGWTAVDSSVGGSAFRINADTFSLADATNEHTPFSIDVASGLTVFNGKVTFNAVNSVLKNTVANNKFSAYWYGNGESISAGPDDMWVNYSGSGELTATPNGLQVGNNSGNDQAWLIYNASIPINKNKRYKVTVEAQQTAGTGTAYFGFAGRNYNDTVWVNTSGSNSIGGQFYLVGGWDVPTTMTTKESLYWSVGGTVAGTDGSSIRTDVAYYRPLIIVNYNGQAGTTIIKKFEIEEFEPEVDVSGDILDNNNVFAQSLGFAAGNGYTAYENMVNNTQLGKTLISGGYINTELIQADTVLVNSLNATNAIIAKRLNADTVIANDITGSTITGSYLEGVVIRNSWIDPTSVGMLTLWAEATNITNSSSIYYPYRNNFAFNADGSYTIDANGYYRLGGLSTPITIDGNGAHDISKTYSWVGGTITRGFNSAFSYTNINKGLFIPSYDSYKVSTPNRPISQSPLVNLHNMTGSSSKTIMVSSLLGGFTSSLYIGTYTKATFYINNVIYKIEQVATAPYGMSSRFRVYNANDTVLYSIDVNYTNDQTTHIYKIATLGDFDIIAEFDGHFDNTGGTEPQEYWVSYAYLKIVGNSGGTTTTTSVGPLHNNGDAVKFIVLKDAEGAGTTSGADTFARITTYDLDIVLQP